MKASGEARDVATLAGGPAIGGVLVCTWLLPLTAWAVATAGFISSLIFLAVVRMNRQLGRRVLVKPAVLAALVMYAVALFMVAYASLALTQPGSIQTNGTARPDTLGVASLLATAMGIAGGEVGVHVLHGARVIAHLQLLLVVGAVAGVGSQLVNRLAGEGPERRGELLSLYARVYELLSREPGEVDIPAPEHATEREALAVFRRIKSGDLERFYSQPFEGSHLGDVLNTWVL